MSAKSISIHPANLATLKKKVECNYAFPIDLASNGIPSGAKSNGKVRIWFHLTKCKKYYQAYNLQCSGNYA